MEYEDIVIESRTATYDELPFPVINEEAAHSTADKVNLPYSPKSG